MHHKIKVYNPGLNKKKKSDSLRLFYITYRHTHIYTHTASKAKDIRSLFFIIK